jgi:hypothetical protein
MNGENRKAISHVRVQKETWFRNHERSLDAEERAVLHQVYKDLYAAMEHNPRPKPTLRQRFMEWAGL